MKKVAPHISLFLVNFWNIIDLQCCVSFCYKANRANYVYAVLFGFPSLLGHQRALSRVMCAIESVLTSYLFYAEHQYCIYVNPNLLLHPTIPVSPLVSMFVLYVCVSDHLYPFSEFHLYALICSICLSLSDLLDSMWQFLGPSMSLQTA